MKFLKKYVFWGSRDAVEKNLSLIASSHDSCNLVVPDLLLCICCSVLFAAQIFAATEYVLSLKNNPRHTFKSVLRLYLFAVDPRGFHDSSNILLNPCGKHEGSSNEIMTMSRLLCSFETGLFI